MDDTFNKASDDDQQDSLEADDAVIDSDDSELSDDELDDAAGGAGSFGGKTKPPTYADPGPKPKTVAS